MRKLKMNLGIALTVIILSATSCSSGLDADGKELAQLFCELRQGALFDALFDMEKGKDFQLRMTKMQEKLKTNYKSEEAQARLYKAAEKAFAKTECKGEEFDPFKEFQFME